jgi:tRNA pseudouridine synthase 10
MMIDSKSIDYSKVDHSNFCGFEFRINTEFLPSERKECSLCNDLFEELDEYSEKAVKRLDGIEFKTFLVGSLVPDEISQKEEELWEVSGIEFVESIKFDLNRELRKRLSYSTKKPYDFNNPDVTILFDFTKKEVEIKINSLYILGYYKKLSRGIPQSKWGTPGKYKTSVQEIVAKPIVKITRGRDNAFHGSGREDIDARCLDWRPFVIEIIDPGVRSVSLKDLEKKVNQSKKVKVKLLKPTDKTIVRRIKSESGDKTYKVTVVFSKPVEKKDLRRLKGLIGVISQRTPIRVSHRRADLVRKRLVKELRYRQINKKTIELTVKVSSGLYVKELVHGDEGRTKPSVAEALNVDAKPKNLDVIKIERPKNL